MPVPVYPIDNALIARVTVPDTNLFGSFATGQEWAQKQADRAREEALRNYLANLPPGQIDTGRLGEQLLRLGGPGQLGNYISLTNQQIDRDIASRLGGTGIYRPPAAPRSDVAPISIQRTGGRVVEEPGGGEPARPGQTNLTSPTEVPGSFKVSVEEPGATNTLTPRQIAQRTNQDPELVATKLGVGVDQPLTPDEIRGRLDSIRAGGTPQRFAQGPIEAPATGQFTPAQVTIPAQPRQAPAPQPTRPPPLDDEVALDYERRATEAAAAAAAIANTNPVRSRALQSMSEQLFKAAHDRRTTLGGVYKETVTPTPEQKEADRLGMTVDQYKRQTEAMKLDVKQFQEEYTKIQTAGENAQNNMSKAILAKNLTLSPNFTSGPWNEQATLYQQFKSLFGQDIKAATPIEAFNKFSQDLLQERIKSMASSGVGRVLQSEVRIMQQSIASGGITAASNRALLEMIARTYKKEAELADITRNLPPNSANLNRVVADYLRKNPTFTADEVQNPLLLASPDAPQNSARWTPQQWRAWGGSIGLQPGDTVKTPSGYKTIPLGGTDFSGRPLPPQGGYYTPPGQ